MAEIKQGSSASRQRTKGQLDVRFYLDRHDNAWRVERVVVHVAGRVVQDRLRIRDWPAHAGMDALAAAVALLQLKAARSLSPVLRADSPNGRTLVVRCATLWRNVNSGSAKWVGTVFEGVPGVDAKRSGALCNLIRVRGTKDSLTLDLAPWRQPDHFSLGREGAGLSVQQFQQFVDEIGKTGSAVSDEVEGESPFESQVTSLAELAKRRVRRENTYGRPVLAVCGGPHKGLFHVHRRLLKGLTEDLSRLLAECAWHVVHGPRGTGIDAVSAAILRHNASSLTHTLVIGPRELLVSPADVVLVVGGGHEAQLEAKLAVAMRKRIVPIVKTGVAAIDAVNGTYDYPRLSHECLRVLVNSHLRNEVRDAMCDAMRELAYLLTPPEKRPRGFHTPRFCWEEATNPGQ